ncbi:MAG: sugar ABC transporter substrate-binding protein [Oscillochloridaceae bacterium umkhey_bin13]
MNGLGVSHVRSWLLLLALIVLLGLVACSAQGSPPPVATPQPAASRTILVLWHAWPQPESRTLAGLVERFNRTTPGTQVVIQSRPAATLRADLVAAITEGGGPHVALLPSHTLGGLADEGVLLPVDGVLSAEEVANLLPSAVGAASLSNGEVTTLYGIPITFDTLALYYNQANFTGAPPTDTEALLATARGLTDTTSNPPRWGLALNLGLDRTLGYLYAFGGRIFDPQGRVALGLEGRTGAEAWLGWLAALREDQRVLASLDGIAVDNALAAQRAVMTIDWSYAAGTYHTIWPGSMGVAPLPRLTSTGQAPRPYVQSEVLILNVRLSEPEREAAASFARFLLSEEAQRELLRAGRQPVLLSLDLNAEDAALTPERQHAALVFRVQAEAGLPMPNTRLANEFVWSVLTDMHGSALRRLLTPAQAVESADTILRSRLE